MHAVSAHASFAAHPGRVALADVQALCAPASDIRQTRHARRRAAQRNLITDVAYILLWGQEIVRTGVTFHCLRAKDIPAQHRHHAHLTRLIGAVVVTSLDGEVVTVYRSAHALRDIQRKLKYRFTPGWPLIGPDAVEADA